MTELKKEEIDTLLAPLIKRLKDIIDDRNAIEASYKAALTKIEQARKIESNIADLKVQVAALEKKAKQYDAIVGAIGDGK